jgi:hypothetical protein
LSLLWFLHENASDPATRQVCCLAAQDETRHVTFGLAHLHHHIRLDPGLRPRLAAAVECRHDALRNSDGVNEEVLDALVLLAAGSWELDDLASGHDGRGQRLEKLGFSGAEAEALSALHTRNFM